MHFIQARERFSHCILRLKALSEWLSHEQVLLHGDFSADQVIVAEDGRSVNIIDWDRCVYGHPAGDPGSFIARTEMDVINGELTAAQARGIHDALLAGYKMERKINAFDIEWYTAKALMCLVVEPFRKRDAYWPKKAELLLNRVEDMLRQLHLSPECRQRCRSFVLSMKCNLFSSNSLV
ncbi:phosphotransferase family protein [Escherichia coli]